MKKPSQAVKISIAPQQTPEDMESLLACVFWKEPQLTLPAKDFLGYLLEWQMSQSPYAASGWRAYCRKTGLTQSQYSNMLKRLKNAGMVEKVYDAGRRVHVIRTSRVFGETLSSMSLIWKRFTEC